MTNSSPVARAVGIDFGTTNSVIAQALDDGQSSLVQFAAPGGANAVFRSALCFWQDETMRGADQYASDVLVRLESDLVKTLSIIKKSLEVLEERRPQPPE